MVLTGTKLRTRYIDIKKICAKYSSNVIKALPGIHAISGCDSVNAFSGKGKKKTFELMQQPHLCSLMDNLGSEIPPPDSYEAFVCRLYGCPSFTDINNLRYHLFCKKTLQSNQLPPCKDSLIKHVQRANYQCYIWKRALECNPDIPSPDGNGWSVSRAKLLLTGLTFCQLQQQFYNLFLVAAKKNVILGDVHASATPYRVPKYANVVVNAGIH